MALLRSKWLWLVPTAAFLFAAIFFIYRGSPGAWHDQCLTFWKQKKWVEIRALAENLQALKRPNPEVLYFAVFASQQIQDMEGSRKFLSELLNQRALNWNWEKRISTMYQSRSLQDTARLYRTRAVLSLMVLIIALHVLYLWKRIAVLNWSGIAAAIGLILLFL